MKTFHFQYQALAEPVSVDAPAVEQISLDKWWQPASLPVRRRPAAPPTTYVFPWVAIGDEFTQFCTPWMNPASADSGISGTVAWTSPSNAQAEDSSNAGASVTAFQTTEYLQLQNFGFSLPVGAVVSSVAVRIKKGAAAAGQVNLTDLQLMSGVFDDAGSLKGDPDSYNGLNFFATAGATVFGGGSDTWSGYVSSLTSTIVNATDFGVALKATNVSGSSNLAIDVVQMRICYTVAATITVDMWYRQTSEPVRSKPKLRSSEIVVAPLIVAVANEPVDLDRYWQPASLPRWSHKPRPHGGTTDPTFAANTPPAEVTIDQWWAPASTPAWRVKPRPHGGYVEPTAAGFLANAPINVDQWFVQASEPVRSKPKLRTANKAETYEPSLFTPTTLDQWYQPASEPVRSKPPRRQDLQVYPPQFSDPTPTQLDMWFVRPLDPPKTHKPRPHGGTVVPLGIEAPHSRHDWTRQPNQPLPPQRRLPPGVGGMSVVDPLTFMHNPISWWMPIATPVFDRRRKRSHLENGFFTPTWEQYASLEPEPVAGSTTCGELDVYPRYAGRLAMATRYDGEIEVYPRYVAAGAAIECNCC